MALYVDCRSGLGNRLKALASGRRLARRMPGRAALFGWEIDRYHCHCPCHLLFDDPPLTVSPDFVRLLGRADRYGVTGRPTFVRTDSTADVVWVEEENFFYAAGEAGVMWGQYGPDRMSNHAVRDGLLEEFAALVPSAPVAARAGAFVRRHLAGRPSVGVHVRRGDNDWANRFVPDGLFPPAVAAALDARPGDAAVFACSDSPESVGLLRRRFGRRVVTYPVRSLDRGGSYEAVQDALTEMLILAATDVIVRTPSSTFSQCAAWLGRRPTVDVGPLQHPW